MIRLRQAFAVLAVLLALGWRDAARVRPSPGTSNSNISRTADPAEA